MMFESSKLVFFVIVYKLFVVTKSPLNSTKMKFTPKYQKSRIYKQDQQIEGSTIHEISLCIKNPFFGECIPI